MFRPKVGEGMPEVTDPRLRGVEPELGGVRMRAPSDEREGRVSVRCFFFFLVGGSRGYRK